MSTETTQEGELTPAGKPYYVHKGCDGITIWDLSGGFCLRCHAEGLDEDDIERREAAP